MNTSGAAFDSFNVAAERLTGRYGDKPFVTWYDDHRDQRVELSYRTFGNWVAKTANLLVDELGAGPGDRVGAILADHWQTPVVLAACWRAGTSVVVLDPAAPDPQPDGLVAAFVREEYLPYAETALGGTTVVALTADLLGRSQRDLGKALSFSRLVPSMGDEFAGGPDLDGDALTAGGQAATMPSLLAQAAALAGRTSLGDADRLLSGRPLLTVDGPSPGLLAPFTRRRRVVLVAGLDPAASGNGWPTSSGDVGRARPLGRRRPRQPAATARARSLPPAGAAR